MLNIYAITLIMLCFISACGSSSSNEAGSESNASPEQYLFTLSAVAINKCDVAVPFTDIEMLLQDDNWQVINRYSTDLNGLISFETTNKHINYTLVAKYQQDGTVQEYDITSFYQVETTTPATYETANTLSADNSNCDCITQNINLEHRAFSNINTVSTSFNYEQWQQIDNQSSYFTNAEICRVQEEEWPIQSISLRGTDINDNAVGVASLLSDFVTNDENLWQAAAIEVAELAPLPEEHTYIENSQTFSNGQHFNNLITPEDTEILIFNSHQYISESLYQAKSTYEFESLQTIFGYSIFSSYHQIISSIYQDAFTVMPETDQPDIDNTRFSELSSDGSYDYSELSDYPMVKIMFGYEVLNNSKTTAINWTLFGPNQGLLPSHIQLPGYESIITPDTNIQSTDIKIIKSAKANNYNDYMKYYQGNTDSDFNDNLKYFHLQLAL